MDGGFEATSQLTRLVAAAAAARSGFPLTLLVAALGKAEPVSNVLLDVRLVPEDDGPLLFVGCFFRSVGLTGELPVTSRFRVMVPFLRLAPGASGSGRMFTGTEPDARRLPEELLIGASCARVRGLYLTPVTNSWFNASLGLRRLAGSHRRHRAMKSRKLSSSHFKT